MLRHLRAAVAEVAGLFITGWVATFAVLAVLAGGWALNQRVHGAAAGFAMAGALAALLVGDALLVARRQQQ